MKNNFCIVPWIHLNTEPSGVIKPCCAFSPEHIKEWPTLQKNSLEEVWNSTPQRNLRKQFLNDERPNGCATCFMREDSGSHSMRMAMNDRFNSYIDDAISKTDADGNYDNFNLIYWDFRFSNICNFKCRMCGHSLSSSWYEESGNNKIPKILNDNYHGRDLMKYVDQFIDTVEEIYFAGGEPLIMPEHYAVLDKLIEKKRFDVFLRYNTNLSTLKYKNYDLIDTWKKFKKVDLFLSLDGVEQNAEYTRSGTDWKRVDKNLSALADLTKVNDQINIFISSTIHVLNVFQFTKLVDRMISLDISPRKLILSNLIWPTHLKISILPDNLKDKIRKIYSDHLSTIVNQEYKTELEEKYNSIFYFLDQPYQETDRYHFVKEIIRLDISRSESIYSAVPELTEWYKSLLVDKNCQTYLADWLTYRKSIDLK